MYLLTLGLATWPGRAAEPPEITLWGRKMKARLTRFLERYWMALALLVMLPVYWNIALLNEQRVDYINNGFFKFWLAGRMTWTPEHPLLAGRLGGRP